MAGFLGNLFGNLFGKKNAEKKKKDESFFLDPDSSKTVGDIDYMRKSATIRRTFPKAKTGGGGEIIVEVSSSEVRIAGETPISPEVAAPQSAQTDPKRSKDSSMDMFRNMAKDIRKS